MVDTLVAEVKHKMESTIASVGDRLLTVRTGTASASVLSAVQVNAYGSQMRMQEVATVSAPEPRMLIVSPYDKSILRDIERAIQGANLGLNPQSDGNILRIPIPPLTEETRKEIVKGVRKMVEDGKVAIRNVRRDANDRLKKAEKAGEISEDDHHRLNDEIQKLTGDFCERLDKIGAAKEEEVMTV